MRHTLIVLIAVCCFAAFSFSQTADELIAKNPCQVRGAAVERAPERPIATMTEVKALASLMPGELRIAVVLAESDSADLHPAGDDGDPGV